MTPDPIEPDPTDEEQIAFYSRSRDTFRLATVVACDTVNGLSSDEEHVAAIANLRARCDGWERLAKARGRMRHAQSTSELSAAWVDEGKAIAALAVAGVADPMSLEVMP